MNMIKGAQILRERFERDGVAPDASDAAVEVEDSAPPFYRWTGTKPDPARARSLANDPAEAQERSSLRYRQRFRRSR